MKDKWVTANDIGLWEELIKLFDLPPYCRSINISMEAGKYAEITVKSYIKPGSRELITTRYNLIKQEKK